MTARFAGFTLDAEQRRLALGEREIHLTPKAFDLLVLLVDEAPRVVRKRELHERLWPDTFVSDVTLVGLVKELRRALDDRGADARVIRTAHGVGYACCAAVEKPRPSRSAVSCWMVVGTRKVPLQDGDNLIGRDPAAVVRVDAEGVSRRHACVTGGHDGVIIEDLESKNGTSVNDEPIGGPMTLSDGDRILIGATVVVFHALASGRSTEALTPPVRNRKQSSARHKA
jgi:DNA-binding winged helix-turn-helix (wHTH) protein